MTQEEKWQRNYNEVVEYMDTHHRNPSKHRAEDRLMVNWMKQQRKLMNRGELRPDRVEMFKGLQAKGERLKRANQWEEVAEILESDILRTYQQEMLDRLEYEWKKCRSVMVQMPTGTGKTVLLAQVIKNEELRMKNSSAILVVAHRRELIEQIKQAIDAFDIDRENDQVYVESIQKLSNGRTQAYTDLNPSLIIVDEAHHALAETYKELWERWPEAKFLGLTATPCRLSGEPFTDLFDVLLQSWSVREFIEKGWLSDLDYISVLSDSEDIRKVAGLDKRGTNGDYQTRQASLVLDTEESIKHLYLSYKEFADRKKGIVYAINVEHARHIAAYYREKGLRCAVIDTKTPAIERQKTVEDYRLQNLDILVNCEIFTEGFDVPAVEFIQLARPTMSLALYLQQVGRGMRVSKGKEKIIILDQVGLYLSMGLPTAERDWQGMFTGEIKGKGLPLSQYRMTEMEMAVNRRLVDKVLVHGEMVRLSDYERMKAEVQQEWNRKLQEWQQERERQLRLEAEEEKRQRRERMAQARREARLNARREEQDKVEWYGSLGIFKEQGYYGLKRKGMDGLPPIYEAIKVLPARKDGYFALARLPKDTPGNDFLWTLITKDGEDLHLRMAGEYIRREDGIFEFRVTEGGRYVTYLHDVEYGKSYVDARLVKIGGIRFFRKNTEDGYILRGGADDRMRFEKSDVVYNEHIAIIGDELFVKSEKVQCYQIAGYHGDRVIVRNGKALIEIRKDGTTGKTLQRMPKDTTTQPDFQQLELRRETTMSNAASLDADQRLRDYQRQMLDQFWTTKKRNVNVLLQMPVGAGKTRVLLPVIREENRLRVSFSAKGKKVLIVTPHKQLVGQIMDTLERCAINARILEPYDDVRWYEGDVAVTTTDFLHEYLDTLGDDYKPTLIVYDEAHLMLAEDYALLQQRWPKAKRIGITATPIGANGLVLKKVFSQFVPSPSLQQLIDSGWLKDIEYVDAGKDTYNEVERLCQAYLKYANGRRGIVCAIDRKHARRISECYNSHGVKAAVCLDLTKQEGKQQVENLRNGNVKVLVEVRQFSEGSRCPDIEFVQLACPTESLATYLHQVECGMRIESKKSGVGDFKSPTADKLMVLDHVGAKEKFGLPTDERDWKSMYETGAMKKTVKRKVRKTKAKKEKKEKAVAPPKSPAATKWQLRMLRLLGKVPPSGQTTANKM